MLEVVYRVSPRQRAGGVSAEDAGGFYEGLVSMVSATVTYVRGKGRQGGHKKTSPVEQVRSGEAGIPDAPHTAKECA
jgi:hypothetical protein